MDTKNLYDVSFFIGYGYLKDRLMNQYKDILKPLPFYAINYLIHGNNWSDYQFLLAKYFFKTMIKYVVRGKWLSAAVKWEFGIV